MAKNNECYHVADFNLKVTAPNYCDECSAAVVLLPKRSPVIKYCSVSGNTLYDVYAVCRERNSFKNRLRRFFMIGYSHTDRRIAKVHAEDLSKVAEKIDYED